jgi:hypothetical protein
MTLLVRIENGARPESGPVPISVKLSAPTGDTHMGGLQRIPAVDAHDIIRVACKVSCVATGQRIRTGGRRIGSGAPCRWLA